MSEIKTKSSHKNKIDNLNNVISIKEMIVLYKTFIQKKISEQKTSHGNSDKYPNNK